MSRYRPPQTEGSCYITPEGLDKLKLELEFLWSSERPSVAQAVSEAAAMGDRSENAEYIYGKKRLHEIDRRVRFLRKRIEKLKVVKSKPDNNERVYFGAWITLADKNGAETIWRIVGPDEFNLKESLLSMDSPLAKSLLGKNLRDKVSVVIGKDTHQYEILTINY